VIDRATLTRLEALPCWQSLRSIEILGGGLTNRNFLVEDRNGRCAVRLSSGDLPLHGVFRDNELAATRAAVEIGLAPPILHAEPGLMVVRFIEGRTLTAELVREERTLEQIAGLLRLCHREMGRHVRDASPCFWVFHILRGYGRALREAGRLPAALHDLDATIDALEDAVGPVRFEYAHNDLLSGNLIDDGARLWLIDWEYSGFGSGLFDLGNLATNNDLDDRQLEHLLQSYAGQDWPALRRGTLAMRAAAALRETLWGRVQALSGSLDIDYVAYAEEHEPRFHRHWSAVRGDARA